MGNVTSLADSQVVLGWKHRNVDTLCTIVLCVQDNVLTLIQHVLKDSKAWELLQNQYEMMNLTMILNLKNQLQSSMNTWHDGACEGSTQSLMGASWP